jgi:hypothetical protein
MATTPNWVSVNLQLGYPKPATVDAGVDRNGSTYPSVDVGTMAQFRDIGTTYLGTGNFIFLPGVTSTVAGDVVTYRLGAGQAVPGDVNNGAATERWAGTANTGAPLAVATAATDTQAKWGWYQIQGAAICNISGNATAGNPVYFGQTATVAGSSTAGKQVMGARFGSAQGVPDTGKVVVVINDPHVQGQTS